MLGSIINLISISIEYKDAVDAALAKAKSGGSTVEVIEAFVSATGNTIDDKAAASIIKLIEEAKDKIPELDKSKDEIFEAISYYWPIIRTYSKKYIEAAEVRLPILLENSKKLIDKLDDRYEDIVSLFASADIALQIISEQLTDLTEKES